MTELQFPTGLSEIAASYDTILCDVWGVIHNGRRAFNDACEALSSYRNAGGKVCLITNAPVPKAQVIRYFNPLGVPETAFDDCVSSGDATRALLRGYEGRSVWLFGTDRGFDGDRALWKGLNIELVDQADASAILCMGMQDNANDHPEDYREQMRPGVEAGLPMICANPDIQVRVGDDLIWCAGALAEIYKDEGGDVIYPGKPYEAIYRLALQKVVDLGHSPKNVLCIGDSPITDILGANMMGFDSLYVGTGLMDHSAAFEDEVGDLLLSHSVSATYAMPELSW